MLRSLLILLATLTLAGCASHQSAVPLNSYQTVAATQPAAPVAASPAPTMAASDVEYRINPLDKLRLDVFGESELSIKELVVGANGKINLPLAGEITAEGCTPTELSHQIAAALNRYLRDPQVAVNVTEYTSQKVTVTGAVKVPGVFQAVGQMSLQDAIALGQGLSDYSKSSEILVFRRQGNQRFEARFDLGMIQDGKLADPTILPGDVVVVGYSASRRLFSDTIAVLPAAVGIFLALIR